MSSDVIIIHSSAGRRFESLDAITNAWQCLCGIAGSSPYPGMSGPDVMELVQMGYRMNKPRQCSDELYAIMRDCWQHQAAQRPAFSTLCHRYGDY